jgi:hypothetical protein
MGWQDAPVTESKGWQSAPTVSPTSEIPAPRQSWDDTAYNAAINLIPSMGGQVVQAAEAVTDPLGVINGIGNVLVGGAAKLIGTPLKESPAAKEARLKTVQVWDAVSSHFGDKYGSLEGFKTAVSKDPAGVLADVSTVLTLGGTSAIRLGKIAATSAPAAVPTLEKVGALATKAGEYTNPITPVVNAAGLVGKVAGKGLGYGYRAVEPYMPGGAEAIKNRAYIDALSKDPAQITQAVSMLESGLPIELVATQLNSPGLAALAATSQNASTAIKQLYVLRDKALTGLQTNELAGATQNLSRMQNQLAGQVVNPSQMEVGKTLTTERKALESKARKEIVTPAYNAAFEKAPEPFSFDTVVKKAEQLNADESTRLNPQVAPYTSEALRIYGGKSPEGVAVPAQVTLEGADKLIKAINTDLAAIRGNVDSTSNMTRKNLMELKNAATKDIAIGVSPEANTLYETARTLHRTKVVEPFLKGWVANLEREGAVGTQILAPSAVTKKILSSEEDAVRAVAAFSDSPKALEAIKNGIEGEYRNAVITGAKSHDKWMAEHQYELAALDNAGLGLTKRLESFGDQAKELSNVRLLIDEARKKLPESKVDSANHLQMLTQDLPEVRAVVQQIQSELNRGVSFEKLAAQGKEAGGGVLGLASKAAGPNVASLSHEMTIYNTITNRLKGRLNEKLAAEIAVTMLDSTAAAKAIKQAQTATERSAARSAMIKNELAKAQGLAKSPNALIANQLGQPLRIEVIGGGGQQ